MNELMKIVQPVEIDARKKIDEINEMPVLNRVDFEKASEWLKLVAGTEKNIKKLEKEKCAPHKAEIDAIKAIFAKPLELLATAQQKAREKLNAYLMAERKIAHDNARREFAERQKEAQKELRKLDRKEKTADKYDVATANALRESIADKRKEIIDRATAPIEINQSGENASVRMVWAFDIKDIAQIPSEYLILNEKAVREAIKAGVREIPGLKIYQKPTVAIK